MTLVAAARVSARATAALPLSVELEDPRRGRCVLPCTRGPLPYRRAQSRYRDPTGSSILLCAPVGAGRPPLKPEAGPGGTGTGTGRPTEPQAGLPVSTVTGSSHRRQHPAWAGKGPEKGLGASHALPAGPQLDSEGPSQRKLLVEGACGHYFWLPLPGMSHGVPTLGPTSHGLRY